MSYLALDVEQRYPDPISETYAGEIRALGLPNSKQEIWRYTPLSPLLEVLQIPAVATTSGQIDFIQPLKNPLPVIEHNVLIPMTLLATTQKHTHTLLKQYEKTKVLLTHTWEQQIFYLSSTHTTDAVFQLSIDSDSTGGGHLLCYVDVLASATVRVEIIAQKLQKPVVISIRAKQGDESHLGIVSYIEDSQWVRLDIAHQVLGEQATMTIDSLSLVRENQYAGVFTQLRHDVPGSVSRQTIKNVLYGHALTEYSGGVYVAADAQKTDASQSNKNLVLSDTARALSRPQLRIYADDVKCAHGATMGQLDPEPLFYLQSRGFSKQEAISIVLAGFAEEIIALFKDQIQATCLLAQAVSFLRTHG